ncbi:MAG: glycosyltransferase [Chloroflexus sp.]|uniref:glycosyltransferase family 4 protein n=1 Tax=Chloroflexus sp. TaxID=1904827 RepID=UPI0030B192C6
MNDLLIISHDVVGQRMAGPGIRMWELARTLARQIPVTLIAPRPIDLPSAPGITYGHYTWGDKTTLIPYLNGATTVLANGFVASAHPDLLTFRGRLIVDLYDPIVFENLELFRHRPFNEREEQTQRDLTLLRELLLRGDHFLCATERQRDLYIGGLLALGRVTPALIDVDPLLRNLIDVVPFGVSDDPPQASGQPALRGVLDDLNADHQIILWSSGLWDWLDPLTVVRAMPDVLAAVPQARLVFLAGRHPGQVPEMATLQQTSQLAADLGLLGNGIHFYNEWIPYARRADFLLEAAIMVSLHREHLETRYAAVRSRVLDHFWVGRPSIVSAGDAAAELIREHQAGEVVPIGDSQAVAAALIRLLTDQQYCAQQSAQAAALGQHLRWSQVIEPLRNVVINTQPREIVFMHTPNSSLLETLQRVRNDAIRVQERTWQLEQSLSPNPILRFIQRTILRFFANPQREHNAAALRSMYALAEQIDHTTQFLFQMNRQLQDLTGKINSLEEQVEGVINNLVTQIPEHKLRISNLEAGMQEHNQRQVVEIHQLGQQIRDFAEQIAGLEETTSQILAHIGGISAVPSQQNE